MTVKPKVLIVDDDSSVLRGLAETLSRWGWEPFPVGLGEEALRAQAAHGFDLVLLDVKLPDLDGRDVLRQLLEQDAEQLVIMMTAYGDVAVAVECMKMGAHHYLQKPFDLEELRVLVGRAMELRRMKVELQALRHRHGTQLGPHELIGASPAIARIRTMVKKISQTPRTSVLIQGESGTGKERVAQAIHLLSSRRDAPLLKLNCSAIPEPLMESELFGYEKGSFTDARRSKQGLLEIAHGGTVLLDEIGDLHPGVQPKLLRFLETHSFHRVGGLKEIVVDVRVIAATNRDLRSMVDKGQFREDLYYRLKVLFLEIPPLRDRPEDIPLLAVWFLEEISRELGRAGLRLSAAAQELLLKYPWPGNARELRNVLERAAILCSSKLISPEDLKLERMDSFVGRPSPSIAMHERNGPWSLWEVEREHILRVIDLVQGNKSEAARRLGISRSTLQEKLREYGYKRDAYHPSKLSPFPKKPGA